MADHLYELLSPYLDVLTNSHSVSPKDPNTNEYLNHLTTLSLSAVTTTEPQSFTLTKDSLLLSLQALSKRSHKSLISSSSHLSNLTNELPYITASTALLKNSLPQLEDIVINFSETYNSRSENELLVRRRKSLVLSRVIDRISSILELPTLLSSVISSSSQASTSQLNYVSALDLNAHIQRLHSLHPNSAIINSIQVDCKKAMDIMTSNLISSLKANSLKLAGAMRTISWLRRMSPEIEFGNKEGILGSIFLVCRLANLQQMLGALEPLRALADQEKLSMMEKVSSKSRWETGQHTERYLKRYLEIFREQIFAIISMYRSIFMPSSTTEPEPTSDSGYTEPTKYDRYLEPNLSALGTFPIHLVSLLAETLRNYLPNVIERSSRDSLLTQVLYCAGSLGRLGSDFSLILAFFDKQDNEDEDEDEEWAEIIKKHRMLAGRLELMVGSRDT